MRRLPLFVVFTFALIGTLAPTTLAAPARSSQPLLSALAVVSVGTGSCTGAFACDGATGNIGDNSCNGASACHNLTADIGDNSCNGTTACEPNGPGQPLLTVGDGSCIGNSACYENSGSIGDGSCNGGAACYFHYSVSIGSYSCNADYGDPAGCTSSPVGNCQHNAVTPTPCLPCSIGSWSSNGIGYPDACAPADAGHYVDTIGATTQTACDPGHYQPSTGHSSCISADLGYYVPSAGASSQTPAHAGHYVNTTSATSETACDLGDYQPSAGQTSCIAADLGFYVDHTGATSQTPCPAGQTTTGTGSTSASACFTPYVSPYARKQQAVAELQALLPTGSAEADKNLTKAIANINASLASWRWLDADSLNPLHGFRVFNKERHGITWLWTGVLLANPTWSAVANDAVNQLVAADREVVVTAISESTDQAAIAAANAKLAQADALLAQQQRSAAIYKLRAAWLAVN